jgi:hypothetical protein
MSCGGRWERFPESERENAFLKELEEDYFDTH